MPTIFTKIIAGDIPCHKVAETDDFLAFLDISPLRAGHTLVIPKIEVDYIFDLDDDLYARLFTFAKQVGKAVESVVECERIGIAVIGLEVPHAHIHLSPIDRLSDLDFTKQRAQLTQEEFSSLASRIHSAFISNA
jgi:histidine triad (HIT) family protein